MFKDIQSSKFLSIIHLALFLTYSAFALPEAAWAKNKDENSNSNEGLPVRRVAGGTRGECRTAQTPSQRSEKTPPTGLPLIALMPENLVTTSTESPTLLFYIPAINSSQKVPVEFVLRDNQDQLVYEKTFNLSGQAGIISVTIPASKSFTGLKAEQNYHWYLSIICNSEDRAKDYVVEGWLKYSPLEPALASQLSQATPIEKVHLYQKHNLWHEALYTLAQLKQSHPEDVVISQMWTELLKSITLDMIVSEPLINGMARYKFPFSIGSSHLLSNLKFERLPEKLR